jgi:bifunctional DNA-binding transcriptional regulator/antitoxin component of YhaV-PrlF toxin-antitoxin module
MIFDIREQSVSYLIRNRKEKHPMTKTVPRIRLIGEWLEKAGFKPGDKINLYVQENKIIIMGRMKDLAIEEQQRQAVIGSTGDEDYQYEQYLHQQNRVMLDLLNTAKQMHNELKIAEGLEHSSKRQQTIQEATSAITRAHNWLAPNLVPPEAYEDEASVLRSDVADGNYSKGNDQD